MFSHDRNEIYHLALNEDRADLYIVLYHSLEELTNNEMKENYTANGLSVRLFMISSIGDDEIVLYEMVL